MYIGTLDAASNRATLVRSFTVIDDETGTGFDLTSATITCEIRDPVSLSSILTATNDDGIDMTDADDGIFTLTFSDTQMRELDAKQYDLGITVEVADEVTQIFAGSLPVIDGVIS